MNSQYCILAFSWSFQRNEGTEGGRGVCCVVPRRSLCFGEFRGNRFPVFQVVAEELLKNSGNFQRNMRRFRRNTCNISTSSKGKRRKSVKISQHFSLKKLQNRFQFVPVKSCGNNRLRILATFRNVSTLDFRKFPADFHCSEVLCPSFDSVYSGMNTSMVLLEDNKQRRST